MDFNFDENILLQDKMVLLKPLSWDHFEFLLPVALANPELHNF